MLNEKRLVQHAGLGNVQVRLGCAVELLKQHGPSLKRPLVGEINTSKIKNLKELRPGSSGRSEIRILFVSIRGSRLSY
jgi:hypothetical protein